MLQYEKSTTSALLTANIESSLAVHGRFLPRSACRLSKMRLQLWFRRISPAKRPFSLAMAAALPTGAASCRRVRWPVPPRTASASRARVER